MFEREPMKNHTTFRIGGIADVLITPKNISEISAAVNILKDKNIPFYVIGNGSNLLVSDKGIRGVVVKLFKNFSNILIEGNRVSAQAGALLSGVAAEAAKHGLSGLEFAAGIPGTIGGAVLMNAGAYGGEMKDVVVKTKYLDTDGDIKDCADHDFSYRSSIFQKNGGIILQTEMQLCEKCKEEIYEKMEKLSQLRREKQPLNYPSAGSAFKRPQGFFAAKLIDDAGLRGFKIGGAQVSEKHTGFVINTGDATCVDVCALLDAVQDMVLEKYGIQLQREVKFLGEV